MTYELLITNLIDKKRSLRHRFRVENKYDVYVPDNYDQHEPFGFYQGDLENAFAHACRMIDQLMQQGGMKSDSDKEQLVCDWKNYLRGLYQWEKATSSQTKYLIHALIALGMEQNVYEQIMQYHQEYKEETEMERGDGPYHVPLNFSDLYGAHGDYLLLHKGDPELALQFYELASLDWLEPKGDRGSLWNKQYREYKYYYQGTFILKMQNHEKGIFEEIFRDIQTMLHECGERDAVLDRINVFFREYTALVTTKPDKDELRRVLFMAYRLREQGLPIALYYLVKESETTIREYWKSVLSCLRASKDERMEVLRQYIDRNKKMIDSEYHLFFRVLQLNKMMLHVEDAKECLLAEESGDDIAYYTSLETFSYLFPGRDGSNPNSGNLSIMNIAYMNDPTEGQMLKRYLFEDKKIVDDMYQGRRNATYPYVFMKCFTTLIDDLPMWEMYGNHAKGCCIVLRRGRFFRNGGYRATIPLYRICYLRINSSGIELVKEDNRHIENFSKLATYMKHMKQIVKEDPRGKRWYLKILSEIQYLFKNADYHHEQELRLIYQYHHWEKEMMHTAGDFPKLYIQSDFYPDIKEIILGPKFENRADKMPYLQEQIERMCEKTGGNIPKITLSSIEYR